MCFIAGKRKYSKFYSWYKQCQSLLAWNVHDRSLLVVTSISDLWMQFHILFTYWKSKTFPFSCTARYRIRVTEYSIDFYRFSEPRFLFYAKSKGDSNVIQPHLRTNGESYSSHSCVFYKNFSTRWALTE